MFNIGDKVFKARYGRNEKWVTCPDCFGTKHVTVILGDGTAITIECGGCDPGGYKPSCGVIKQYDYETQVHEHTVTGVTIRASGAEYELDKFCGGGYWTGNDKDVFGTKEEAHTDGERQRAEHENEENRRLMAKTKDHKSWAWNYRYHRDCIKRAEKEIEYHSRKAQICLAKDKAA